MNVRRSNPFSKKMIRHIIFSSFLEFGPVLIFLASFEYASIYESTVILMVSTILSTIITYRLQKRIPYLALYVALITIIFGYMTIHFHAVRFLQMRDTLYDLTCALTLVLGQLVKVPFMKLAFNEILPMKNSSWTRLTYLWIFYFILIAGANEFIRRFLPFEDWLYFKGYVILFTCIYGFFVLYISYEAPEERKLM